VVVRETPNGFILIEQHEHALISGEFARRWRVQLYPQESTLYAISQHDVSWRPLDEEVLWNEEKNRPYAFTDYPAEPKVRAYERGIDVLESHDTYAACLCSMHYETLVRKFGRSEAEARFAESESRRQERLRSDMSDEEVRNLERNLRFLRLCDGLSLFVCLNAPGDKDYPPPYPEGFAFDGETFEPVWEDERTLRLDPSPFSGDFDLSLPYRSVGKNAEFRASGDLDLKVIV
jgi:hypothetical protein